jgi:hypothetical protein
MTSAKNHKRLRRMRWFLFPALFSCAISTTALVHGAEVDIRYIQNGETLSLARGDTLVVRLPINRVNPAASSLFNWTITSMDTDKLKLASGPEWGRPPKSGGPSLFQVFRFQAIGTGSAELTLEFMGHLHIRRPNTKVFRVTVVILTSSNSAGAPQTRRKETKACLRGSYLTAPFCLSDGFARSGHIQWRERLRA